VSHGGWDQVDGPRSRARIRIAACLSACLSACLLALVAAATASAEGTATRYFHAQQEAFVVPQGVTSVQVVAIGGHGGSNVVGAPGGQGARVTATLSVTPGTTLYVHVGGAGVNGGNSGAAGTGGGSSDVRSAPVSAGLAPDPRLIVAGAGGGAGGESSNGGGTGSEGANAEESAGETLLATGGEAGSQLAGGEAGFDQSGCPEATPEAALNGELEIGGAGGVCPIKGTSGVYHGGGGGSGYYGGGGGGAGGRFSVTKTTNEPGGGGGSSLVPEGGSVTLAGAETAQVQISYQQPPNPPAVVTGAPSKVRETTVTVSGTVNPEDEEVTSCSFEYGTSEFYGLTAPCSVAPGSGVAPVALAVGLTGLAGGTSYHYRLVASNASGTGYGADRTFTTLPQEPPVVTGVSPNSGSEGGGTSVTITGSNLNGATAVNFGATAAASFTVESSTSITAISPAGKSTAQVTVTTPGGTSVQTSEDRFFYIVPPTAFTQAASSIRQTTATLNASAFTSAAFTDCHFDYGGSPAYGSSAPCSQIPGPGTSSLTASVAGLSPNTTYHFRIVVANVSGTAFGADRSFTTLPPQSPPEYGRCLKVTTGTGQFGAASCTTLGGEKKYEWYPAFAGPSPMLKTHFTTKIKELTEAKLQTVGGKLITCKGETGTGEYSGNTAVANVTMTFTGCHLGELGSCQSSAAAEGEVVTATLQGELGVIKKSLEGPIKNTIGTDLKPVSGEVLAAFACAGSPVSVTGSVIGEVKRDAMLSKAPIKFVQTKGIQKPTRFEGGAEELLVTKLGEGPSEHSGLSFTVNQTDEEKVEVNSVA
jgi:hypothetical protein